MSTPDPALIPLSVLQEAGERLRRERGRTAETGHDECYVVGFYQEHGKWEFAVRFDEKRIPRVTDKRWKMILRVV